MIENNKFAYLVMAHKADYTLKRLLSAIDDERNDIYLHVDKKSDINGFKELAKDIKQSKLFFVTRTKVEWAAYSQIEAELNLFREANKKHYRYYHLISGSDLPIKSQDYIHDFFNNANKKEFVHFESDEFKYSDRVHLYYPFQKNLRHNTNSWQKLRHYTWRRIGNKLVGLFQKTLGINLNSHINFQKGAQWVSITDELVSYILQNERWIHKTFGHSFCTDEVFIQTLVHNSEYFKQKLYHPYYDNSNIANQRLIDWNRGKPYVFKKQDFEELKNSPYLFARKFDSEIDKEIIDLITKEYEA
ncbi:beta-1,6-N-acetylglucosaminyltransferase [Leuconostoc lactis]|uniref:beta-1,6-N-acetylglucosaminyltransferase n=1 Tax=Leuconostoc lactis TaxID=1246 RepID=UPI0037463D41